MARRTPSELGSSTSRKVRRKIPKAAAAAKQRKRTRGRTPTELGQSTSTAIRSQAPRASKHSAAKAARRQKRSSFNAIQRTLLNQAERERREFRKEYGFDPPGLTESEFKAAHRAQLRSVSPDLRSTVRDVGKGIEGLSEATQAAATVGSIVLPVPLGKGRAVSAAGRILKGESKAAKAGQAATKPVKRKPRGHAAAGKPEPTKLKKVRRIGKRRRERVKSRAKRAASEKKAEWGTKAGRRVKSRRAVGTATTIGVGAPAVAMTATELGKNTGIALVEEPGKTLKTTARTAVGIPAAAAGTVADIGATGKRAVEKLAGSNQTWEEVLDPLEGQLAQQERFIKTYGKALGSEGEAAAVKTIQEDLGLVPLATGALTSLAFLRGAGVKLPAPGKPSRKVRRLQRQATEGRTPTERRKAKEALETSSGESARQRHAGRKREAERAAVTGEKREGQWQRETRGKRGRSLTRLIARLNDKPINDHVTQADALNLLGREGLLTDNPAFVREQLETRRRDLKPSKREIDSDEVHTRAVLDALLDEPDALSRVLRSKDMRRAMDLLDEMQAGRSVERHEESVGIAAAAGRPDPRDERARLMHVARAEDIRTPEERIPPELEGRTDVVPQRGESAEKLIRAEAARMAKQARAARQTALRERARAKQAARALNVRRVADDRRVERFEGQVEGPPAKPGRAKETTQVAVKDVRVGDEVKIGGRYEQVLENRGAVYGKPGYAELSTLTAKRINMGRVLRRDELVDVRRTKLKRGARSAKERRLEKRIAAWEDKARRAKSPETRRRYEAKVEQLRKQLTETRATARLSASPARLRAVGRVSDLRRRADRLEERADTLEAEARFRRSIVDRFRRAESLERQAARADDPKEAKALRDQAATLRQEGQRSQDALLERFVAETNERIAEKGYRQPVYLAQRDVSDRGGLNVQQDFPGAKAGRKERFRTGALAEQGRIDESARTLLESAYTNRLAIEQRKAGREFLTEHTADADGRIHTGPEWRKLQRAGKVPRGHVLVPAQEFAAALQRGSFDAVDALLVDSLKPDVQRARWASGGKGKLYAAVPESALREFRAQTEPLGKGWRLVRGASRLQTGLLLATSPAWFAFQLVATPLAMIARNPNPVAWGRVAVKAAKAWKKIPARARADFSAHFGATSADLLQLGDTHVAMKPETVRSMSNGLRVAFKTPMGRMLAAIGANLKKGGPLIAFNRKYEAALRNFEALLEMDRATGLNRKGKPRIGARVNRYLASVAHLSTTTGRHLDEFADLPFEKQVEAYTRNPKRMRELEDAVTDAVGNWGALSKREKQLASVVIFYPFVRFSLRWLFYSFPKNNPVKAGVLLNLSQSNAIELEELLGGAPSFFSDFGQIVTHTGEGGEGITGLNLARAAPGSNVLVETAGSSNLDPQAAVLRPLQPVIGSTLLALGHKDAFGNEQEDASVGELLARAGLGLSPATRPLAKQVGPEPSDISELFRAIEGRGEWAGLQPDFITDLRAQREVQELARLLDKASNKPTDGEIAEAAPEEIPALARRKRAGDRAQDRIDALMRAHGLETEAEQEARSEEIGRRFGAYNERTIYRDQDSGLDSGGIFKSGGLNSKPNWMK